MRHSVFVTCPKCELYERRACWRQATQRTKSFLDFSPHYRLGPVVSFHGELRLVTEYEVGDAHNLALLIV